jgi:hypothetical protein
MMEVGHIRRLPSARLLPRAPSFDVSLSLHQAGLLLLLLFFLPIIRRIDRPVVRRQERARHAASNRGGAYPTINAWRCRIDSPTTTTTTTYAVVVEWRRRHGRDRTQRPRSIDRSIDQERARHATREKAAGGEPQQAVPSRIYCMVQRGGWVEPGGVYRRRRPDGRYTAGGFAFPTFKERCKVSFSRSYRNDCEPPTDQSSPHGGVEPTVARRDFSAYTQQSVETRGSLRAVPCR